MFNGDDSFEIIYNLVITQSNMRTAITRDNAYNPRWNAPLSVNPPSSPVVNATGDKSCSFTNHGNHGNLEWKDISEFLFTFPFNIILNFHYFECAVILKILFFAPRPKSFTLRHDRLGNTAQKGLTLESAMIFLLMRAAT